MNGLFVVADHGSAVTSLVFLGPVAAMLLVLLSMTVRDRRRGR